MAFRDVRIRVDNMSSSSLSVAGTELKHGEFTSNGSPPATVDADRQCEWRAASNGVLTGTEGRVTYQILPGSATVTIGWANPAVGNTFFKFDIADSDGNFVFFVRHFAVDGSGGLGPGETRPIFAVTQGDIGDETGQILPLPFQPRLSPHAWFDIGLRDRREPVRIGRWLRSLGVDPANGLRSIELGRFNVRNLRKLIEQPSDWKGVIV